MTSTTAPVDDARLDLLSLADAYPDYADFWLKGMAQLDRDADSYIRHALRSPHPLDHTAARLIAARHARPGSSLAAFVDTGAVAPGIEQWEIDSMRRGEAMCGHEDEIGFLAYYFSHNGPRGPLSWWAEESTF